MKVQIMSPAAACVNFKVPPAPRLASLEGKTIGLYNNRSGGADIAVDWVAEHISRRYSNVKFERYGPGNFSFVSSLAHLEGPWPRVRPRIIDCHGTLKSPRAGGVTRCCLGVMSCGIQPYGMR